MTHDMFWSKKKDLSYFGSDTGRSERQGCLRVLAQAWLELLFTLQDGKERHLETDQSSILTGFSYSIISYKPFILGDHHLWNPQISSWQKYCNVDTMTDVVAQTFRERLDDSAFSLRRGNHGQILIWLVVCIGNNNPNWLIFFRGVETTNQSSFEAVSLVTCRQLWEILSIILLILEGVLQPAAILWPTACSALSTIHRSTSAFGLGGMFFCFPGSIVVLYNEPVWPVCCIWISPGFPVWYVLGWSRFSYFLRGIGLPHEATLPQQFGSLVGLVGSLSMSEVGAAKSEALIR
jgi:hypothetical protein